jgi:phospholipase C
MRVRVFSGIILAVGACLAPPVLAAPAVGSTEDGSAHVAGPAGVIKHVLLIVQENRTPDNLFHGLRGADIANKGRDSSGKEITLTPIRLDNRYDLGHSHADFLAMYDGGKMDGADKVAVRCDPVPACPPPHAAFHYVDPAQVAPYFELAKTYSFADRMFQSNQGPSFPAHQYLISGTSVPSDGGKRGKDLVSENPKNPRYPTGCVDSPSKEHVALINPKGNEPVSIYPCFDHATLMDLLDQAGVGWTYYTADTGNIWTAPNAISHLRSGPAWAKVVTPQSRVLEDIAAGRLASVSWIMPDLAQSDHARVNQGTGPSWVAAIVNAIGNSAYWKDTAVFITWDDWGGWYDHVAPPIHSAYESGFRVPLIVASPYARKGYVSHVTHNFGSLLKFVEETFSLPSLGYEDARSDDLADCFDFSSGARPYQNVAAPLDAAYFIRRGRENPQQAPPDDD